MKNIILFVYVALMTQVSLADVILDEAGRRALVIYKTNSAINGVLCTNVRRHDFWVYSRPETLREKCEILTRKAFTVKDVEQDLYFIKKMRIEYVEKVYLEERDEGEARARLDFSDPKWRAKSNVEFHNMLRGAGVGIAVSGISTYLTSAEVFEKYDAAAKGGFDNVVRSKKEYYSIEYNIDYLATEIRHLGRNPGRGDAD